MIFIEPDEPNCAYNIPGWYEIQGRHIYLGNLENDLSKYEAEAKAIEAGGSLFEIRSSEDQLILDTISNCYPSCSRFWLGGDDLASTGNWIWASDLSPISNVNFMNIDGVGDCIDFELCGDYQWHRARCGGQEIPHGFIAEKGKFLYILFVRLHTAAKKPPQFIQKVIF